MIRTGRESQCLPYAGFLDSYSNKPCKALPRLKPKFAPRPVLLLLACHLLSHP